LWWQKALILVEIAVLRVVCLKVRKKLIRSYQQKSVSQVSEHISYKESKKNLKNKLGKAKRTAEMNSWGLSYKIVTKKLVDRRPIRDLHFQIG